MGTELDCVMGWDGGLREMEVGGGERGIDGGEGVLAEGTRIEDRDEE